MSEDSPQASFADFQKLDIRVGKILEAAPLEKARKPAYRLKIDFGSEIGVRQSSAQITDVYTSDEIVGRLILGVVNFPPMRVAGFKSEVLTLGIYSDNGDGPVVLIKPDDHPAIKLGDRLG